MWKIVCLVVLQAICVHVQYVGTRPEGASRKSSHGVDYCDICPDHVLCEDAQTCLNCYNIVIDDISYIDVSYIVYLHNRLRNTVALGKYNDSVEVLPSATRMWEMQWDIQLATFAQVWVSHCSYSTDGCRNTNLFNVSQIVLVLDNTTKESAISWRMYIEHWEKQLKYFTEDMITSYTPGEYEEISQILWHNTTYVGCGFIRDNRTMRNMTIDFLVCNYAPAGLIEGQAIYEIGEPRCNCPINIGCKLVTSGLCSGGVPISLNPTIASVLFQIYFLT